VSNPKIKDGETPSVRLRCGSRQYLEMVVSLPTRNYREMRDEELEALSKKLSKNGLTEDPTESHRRALLAVQNPTRREILAMLKSGALTTEEIAEHLGLDEKILDFHLQFLVSTFYVTVQGNLVDLTPLGVAYTRNVITED
jgi:DNA-binding transcriptional ArsR family regulator